VLTVPPTTWAKIKFTPGLPATLNPQMGPNLKYLAHLKKRVWNDSNLSPYILSDSFLAQTWDGTDNQEGDEVSLNCFSGGPSAELSMAIGKSERDAVYTKFLESIYPGYKDAFVKSRYMDWPRENWTGAGYSFPAPGQITALGPVLWKGIGNLHFAGEHTSYAFIGYMEGGLNSGVQLARRIAQRDGLNIPEIPMPPTPEGQEPVVEGPMPAAVLTTASPTSAPTTEPTTKPE